MALKKNLASPGEGEAQAGLAAVNRDRSPDPARQLQALFRISSPALCPYRRIWDVSLDLAYPFGKNKVLLLRSGAHAWGCFRWIMAPKPSNISGQK